MRTSLASAPCQGRESAGQIIVPYSIVFPVQTQPEAGGCLLVHFVTCTHRLSHLYIATGEGNLSPHPPSVGYSQTHLPLASMALPAALDQDQMLLPIYAHCLCPSLFLLSSSQEDTYCTIQNWHQLTPFWSQETKVQAFASPSLGALRQGVRNSSPTL